jgi:hypothetical protein
MVHRSNGLGGWNTNRGWLELSRGRDLSDCETTRFPNQAECEQAIASESKSSAANGSSIVASLFDHDPSVDLKLVTLAEGHEPLVVLLVVKTLYHRTVCALPLASIVQLRFWRDWPWGQSLFDLQFAKREFHFQRHSTVGVLFTSKDELARLSDPRLISNCLQKRDDMV